MSYEESQLNRGFYLKSFICFFVVFFFVVFFFLYCFKGQSLDFVIIIIIHICDYICRAIRKRVFRHMWTAKAQIRIYDWRAKVRMILCARARWPECAALWHIFAWRGPYYNACIPAFLSFTFVSPFSLVFRRRDFLSNFDWLKRTLCRPWSDSSFRSRWYRSRSFA